MTETGAVGAGGPMPPKPISKTQTHVTGLDEILHGGLPTGRTTLVNGGPGSGKTVFGLEFIYRAALDGEPGIFISFEEDADSIRRNGLSLGWDLPALEEAGMLRILDGQLDPAVIRSGDFDINGLLAILGGQATARGAQNVVIVAIDGLLRISDDRRWEREQLEMLHRWLLERRLTALLTAKAFNAGDGGQTYEFMEYMVDCILKLDQRVDGQVSVRRLRIVKYRGSDFERNEFPFAISESGIVLVPISRPALDHAYSPEILSTGNDAMDELLGGGLVKSSITLLTGASGTGKTSLASTIAIEAYRRGQRVLYVQFEESRPAMVGRMLSAGIDLRPALESGLLRIEALMPETLGVEEHLIQLLHLMREHAAEVLIVDAVSATVRMHTDEAAYDFLVRLANACRPAGVTLLMTNQSGEIPSDAGIVTMISSLIDTVIRLEYREEEDLVHRTLLVLKSRGMRHSSRRHRFLITDHGIEIIDRPGDGAAGN